MRTKFILTFLLLLGGSAALSWWNPWFWPLTGVLLLVFAIGVADILQKKQTIRRNYPLIGWGRYVMEDLRPKVYQYFVESDTDGRPISRIFRSIVYQRAKKVSDTVPFGTQMDVYRIGYEWINHSMHPLSDDIILEPRVTIGGPDCTQPYHSSVLNIAAMSYGSLSKNAVLALNKGAQMGGFAQNTGEGSISPFHLEPGGDIIWQIGTGYFGCRTSDGQFNPEMFQERASLPQVKMIEIKLSQGAKPGHGGILPASKNTPEIANIRGVEPGTKVVSPPFHRAFADPKGLLEFVAQLRSLSGGKPVGFKLCVGNKEEFLSVCMAMMETGIKPDFIVVDGGEGGTGAAPLEFTNSVGMPLRDGLSFVYDALRGFDLKKDIKIIASGKVISAFDVIRALALGADLCYSARAMMLALGCIQSLLCNHNNCPTGIATQDKKLMYGLDPGDKAHRVFNYHHETMESVKELLSAAGVNSINEVNRHHLHRRIGLNETARYDEIYPHIQKGSLLQNETVPSNWRPFMERASSEAFAKIYCETDPQ